MPHTSTEVARIQWKTWSSDRIVYYGCEMKRGEFMPKAGLFSELSVLDYGPEVSGPVRSTDISVFLQWLRDHSKGREISVVDRIFR